MVFTVFRTSTDLPFCRRRSEVNPAFSGGETETAPGQLLPPLQYFRARIEMGHRLIANRRPAQERLHFPFTAEAEPPRGKTADFQNLTAEQLEERRPIIAARTGLRQGRRSARSAGDFLYSGSATGAKICPVR